MGESVYELTTAALFDLEHTRAAALLAGCEYPWQVLGELKGFIRELGAQLDGTEFERVAEDVWVHRDAHVFGSAYIGGPAIIDAGTEVRHCAFIRGAALVGRGCVVGNSVELKNCILFDGVQTPHYNYVGDSILGYKAHMGAGSITSNVKSDKTPVSVRMGEVRLDTGLKKLGALLGDGAEIGCNSVLNPGTVIGRRASVYPTSSVRGYVGEGMIYKRAGEIVQRRI